MVDMFDYTIAKDETEKFIFAGDGWFTLTSRRTGNKITYNIYKAKNGGVWYVYIKTEVGKTYFGYIKRTNNKYNYFSGKDREYLKNDERLLALMWYIYHLKDSDIDNKVILQHLGKCCKCGRLLRDSESIKRGIGSQCAKIVFGK